MLTLKQTAAFSHWQQSLRDPVAQYLVAKRLTRMRLGQIGDSKAVGDGVHEIRIHAGPGYRIYYCWHGSALVLLLCGGDKGSQARDIRMAKKLAKEERSHG